MTSFFRLPSNGRARVYVAVFGFALATAAHSNTAVPQPILGEWKVKDGTANVHTLMCGEKMVGVISWVKEPGTDEHNPDPAKQKLTMLGLPILLGFAQDDDNRWAGKIYNAENGKTYEGSVTLTAPDTLHIKGCLISGALCGGEDWTRVSAPPPRQLKNKDICERATQ